MFKILIVSSKIRLLTLMCIVAQNCRAEGRKHDEQVANPSRDYLIAFIRYKLYQGVLKSILNNNP